MWSSATGLIDGATARDLQQKHESVYFGGPAY
jgi:hypothetical protein